MVYHTHWILQCVSTVSYSYLINDSALGKVTLHRGIRHGDPLSPYIFILYGQVLSRLYRGTQESGEMTGIKVTQQAPRINHLLFADDTMFFIKETHQSCSVLNYILQDYG